MAGVYPDPSAAAELTTIARLRAWAGLSEEALAAVAASTGDLGTDPRFIAMLPAVIWRGAIAAARIDPGAGPRPLTSIEAAKAGTIWRVAQRLAWVGAGNEWATFADVDPHFSPTAACTAIAPGSPRDRSRAENQVEQRYRPG